MATHPMGSQAAGQPQHWYASSPTFNRSYVTAALRAGVIALILLGVLVLVVLT